MPTPEPARGAAPAPVLVRPGLQVWAAPGLASKAEALGAPDFLAGAWARTGGGVVGRGRGEARLVALPDGAEGVWRHDRHGGLFGSVLGDRYATPARLAREVATSAALRGHGIATPPVLVAVARRVRGWWRQDLVTWRVPGARTVFELADDPAVAAAACDLLTSVLDLGLDAPDLHPDNLLWEPAASRCWLVDLAGARLRQGPLPPALRRRRVARFLRYFVKHLGAVPAPFRGLCDGAASRT